jgi:hypothetical protein
VQTTGLPREQLHSRSRKQRIVHLHIIVRHARGREPLFKTSAHRPAIQRQDARQSNVCLFDVADDVPVNPSSTTSSTEPQRSASTGVPQAIASIMARDDQALHATVIRHSRSSVARVRPDVFSADTSDARKFRTKLACRLLIACLFTQAKKIGDYLSDLIFKQIRIRHAFWSI